MVLLNAQHPSNIHHDHSSTFDTSDIISHHHALSHLKPLQYSFSSAPLFHFSNFVSLLGPLLFEGAEVAFVKVHAAVAQLLQQAPRLAELRVLHGHDPNPQPNRGRQGRRGAVDAKEGQEKRGLVQLSESVRSCQTVNT